ncbi:ribonuclease domain-containing protein [Bulleidia sp. zg-1006]|uniref:ribonuclease domain-containing protein n=1 Tax=Bulleidia sp. zg-1006 TaxID=2806552 RepID=UPI0019392EA2|nr:ribonuclease domain-containing protein [Bulleidia sp. zg-1006]QRG86631.1 hypothetical protein JOS54_07260 [Bulleidia sp. zg-1006]
MRKKSKVALFTVLFVFAGFIFLRLLPMHDNRGRIPERSVDDSKEAVAMYVYRHKKLPSFYMTKAEARKKGWSSGSLDTMVPDRAIGGDRYGNFEGKLPYKNEKYFEADIDTIGRKKRGDKRIIFTKKGDVWYTADHYGHFKQLYKGE